MQRITDICINVAVGAVLVSLLAGLVFIAPPRHQARAGDVLVHIPMAYSSLSDAASLAMTRGNTEIALNALPPTGAARGWYKLNGNLIDYSGSGNWGTYINNNKFWTGWPVNGAQRIDYANNVWEAPEDFGKWTTLSVSFWSYHVYGAPMAVNTYPIFMGSRNAAPNFGVAFGLSGENINFYAYRNPAYSVITTGNLIWDAWHHIVMQSHGGNLEIWADNQWKGYQWMTPSAWADQGKFSIGSRYNGSGYDNTTPNGFFIDELVFSNTNWTTAQRANLWNNGSGGQGSYSVSSPTAMTARFGGWTSSTFKPSTLGNAANLGGDTGTIKLQYCHYVQDDDSDCSFNGTWLTIGGYRAVANDINKKWGRLWFQFLSTGAEGATQADTSMTIDTPAGTQTQQIIQGSGISKNRVVNQ